MAKTPTSMYELAKIIAGVLKTDRYVLMVVDGETGEGKSCFLSQLQQEVAKVTCTPFDYNKNMTYSRKELKTWIDGDKKGENRKQEYSSILCDELISLFFKRNWFDSEQIDGIELLNKCRDRHLFIGGCIPDFWDLDSAIYSLVKLWVHVYERRRAWVHMRDRNPYSKDKWHRKENEKRWKKRGNPYNSIGYLGEIEFPDWTPEEKIAYYSIRNEKRKRTEGQRQKVEKYASIKLQRDSILRFMFDYNSQVTSGIKECCVACKGVMKGKELNKSFTNQAIADVTGMSRDAIRLIRLGMR